MDWWLRQTIAFLQGCLLILVAPAVVGLSHRLSTRLQLRQGPPIQQPYRNLLKLIRRPAVRSQTTSWIFGLAPKVLLGAYGALAFMVPVFYETTFVPADLIVVIALLALGRFVICLAGLDSGAGFGGMGSGREMFFLFLTEIGLALFAAALMIQWRTIALGGASGVLAQQRDLGFDGVLRQPQIMLLGISFGLLVIMESGRIPVDNPEAHLELTMAHRAITLEYAGRDLALIELAEMIKLVVLLTLFGGLFIPLPVPMLVIAGGDAAWPALQLALIAVIAKLIILACILAAWELGQPKLRLSTVDRFGLIAISLSLITILYRITTRI